MDFDAREAAREAARRAGVTLGEWLSGVIAERAAELGVAPDDVDEDERAQAVAEKLAQQTPRAARPARRPAREDDEAAFEDRRRTTRAPAERPRARRALTARDQDALFDAIERGGRDEAPARRAEPQTEDALAEVARRLAALETRLAPPPAEDAPRPAQDDRAAATRRYEDDLAGLHARLDAFAALRSDAQEPARPPFRDRSPIDRAVEEIAQRQADLDAAAEAARARSPLARRGMGRRGDAAPLGKALIEARLRRGPAPTRAPDAQMASVTQDIATAMRAVDGLRRDGVTGPADREALRTLHARLGEIAEMMSRLAPRDVLSSLEQSVRTLSDRVAASRQDGLRESVVSAIEGALLDLKRSLAEFAPPKAIIGVERQMASIARIMETLAQAGASGAGIKQVQEQTREIHDLVAEAMRRTAGIAAVEREIAALSQRLDFILERGGASASSSAAAIADGLEQIRTAVERAEAGGAFPALEARMDDLSRRMDDALAHAAAAIPGMAALSEQIDAVRAAVESRSGEQAHLARLETMMLEMQQQIEQRQAPAEVAELRGLVQQVGRRIDAAMENGFAPSGLDALDQQIRSLGERLDDVTADSPRLARLESMLQGVATRLENPEPAAHLRQIETRLDQQQKSLAAVSDLRAMMQQVGQRLDQMIETHDATGLDDQIRALGARMDDMAAAAPNVDRLERLLEHVSARLDQPLSDAQLDDVRATLALLHERFDAQEAPAALQAIEARLADISHRLEQPVTVDIDLSRIEALIDELPTRLARDPAGTDAFAQIQDQLGEIATRLAEPVSAELDTSRLEAMIEEIAARLDQPVRTDATEKLDETLRLLAGRMAEPARAEGVPGDLGALDERLASLASRLDALNENGSLRSVEQAVSGVLQQLQSLRATEAGAGEEPIRELLTQEMADLRAHHEAADRRTSAALDSLHMTLDKLVARLSGLETRGGGAAAEIETRAAARAAQALDDDRVMAPRAAEADEPRGSGIEMNFAPAPRPAREPEAAPPPPPAETPRPEPKAESRAESRPEPRLPDAVVNPLERALGQMTQPASPPPPPPPPLPDAGAPDVLLEPGSGKPNRRTAGVSMPAEAAEAAPNSQASFIAAVRRAQQAAGVAQGGASAARFDGAVEPAGGRGGASASVLSRAAGFLSARKRQILLGLAGVVLVLGALQALRMRDAASSGDVSAPVQQQQQQQQSKAPEAAPAPARKAAAASTARADSQIAMSATPLTREPSTLQKPAAAPAAPAAPAPRAAAAEEAPATVASIVGKSKPVDVQALGRDLAASAAAGSAEAQYELGVRLADGRGMPRDLALAAQWLEKAAMQDLPPAQYRLGSLYEKGLGVPRDADKARAWYRRAADHGNVKAMHNLAVLLADGSAGKPDYAAAADWFRRAAEYGVRDSQYNLAILSARGLGTSQSLVDSYIWFSVAAAQGDEDAGKKRSDVAARLDTRQLADARSAADAFAPRQPARAANEVAEPEGGWKLAPPAGPRPQRGPGRPKISAL